MERDNTVAKGDNWESPLLVEAVLVWTGWGQHAWPRRDDSYVINRFGSDMAADLLCVIRSLVDDFYSSDAKHVAGNLAEMERMASEEFRKKRPGIADEIVRALAWCYTFDFK
jgi:hypothetical protein